MAEISTISTACPQQHERVVARPRYELADIMRRYLPGYLATHKLSWQQQKVMHAISACRTAELGGHKQECDSCDYTRYQYNPCGNRHCPKCQISAKLKWVKKRLEELLPIPYFHSVFTMPHTLNPLALYNKRVIYDIFFQAAGHTLNAFAQDPRFLAAKLGFIGILHTWGQTLCQHLHLHFIVTAGGISADGQRWVKLPYRKKFLFPVKAVSKRMRKKFAELLRKAYRDGELRFPDKLAHLAEPEAFERFVNKVAWEEWVTFVKKPFAGPEEIIQYIGRYTHRIAISNYRILDIEGGKVTFRYKKYRDGEVTKKTMTLEAEEFIRRFLLHVLPKGFKRIRHFGFLASGCRTKYLRLARELLSDMAERIRQAEKTFEDWFEGLDRSKCPACRKGTLKVVEVIFPVRFSPG